MDGGLKASTAALGLIHGQKSTFGGSGANLAQSWGLHGEAPARAGGGVAGLNQGCGGAGNGALIQGGCRLPASGGTRTCELAGGSLGHRVSPSPRRREPPAPPQRPHTPTNTSQFIRQVLKRTCSEELPCEMCRAAGINLRRTDDGASATSSSSNHSPRVPRRCRPQMTSAREGELLQQVKASVPRLSSTMGKGECGRVAVFGGCIMYSGAAYFAAISALRCGSDLVHVFCEKEAGPVVRSYSPELVVHPVLDQEYGLEEIEHWLPRLHCVVLGPGLGRNQSMGGRLALILERIKALQLPVVLDADGLWHLASNPAMLRGYSRAVITPNPHEFSHLARGVLHREVAPSLCADPDTVGDLARALGNLTVLHKGTHDVISDGRTTEHCHSAGSPRRCGGQGDLLAGLLATFLGWGTWRTREESESNINTCLVAAWGACRLARACAAQAFSAHGRGMLTEDCVAAIHSEFARLYESETFL